MSLEISFILSSPYPHSLGGRFNLPVDIRNVCILLAPRFSALAAWAMYVYVETRQTRLFPSLIFFLRFTAEMKKSWRWSPWKTHYHRVFLPLIDTLFEDEVKGLQV